MSRSRLGTTRAGKLKNDILARAKDQAALLENVLATLNTNKHIEANRRDALKNQGQPILEKLRNPDMGIVGLGLHEVEAWMQEVRVANEQATQSIIDEPDEINIPDITDTLSATNAPTDDIQRMETSSSNEENIDSLLRDLSESEEESSRLADDDDWSTDDESNDYIAPQTPLRPRSPSAAETAAIRNQLANALSPDANPTPTRRPAPIIYDQLPPSTDPNVDQSRIDPDNVRAALNAMLQQRVARPTTLAPDAPASPAEEAPPPAPDSVILPPPLFRDAAAPASVTLPPPPPPFVEVAAPAPSNSIERARAALKTEQDLVIAYIAATPADYHTYPDVAAKITHITELTDAANALDANTTPERYIQLAEQFRDGRLALQSASKIAYFARDIYYADAWATALQALPGANTDVLTENLIQELVSIKNQIKDPHIDNRELANIKTTIDILIRDMQARYDERTVARAGDAPAPAADAPAPAAAAEAAPAPVARPVAAEPAQNNYNQCLQRLSALTEEIKGRLKNENKNKFAVGLRPSTYVNQELSLQIGREMALLEKLPYTPQIQKSVLGSKRDSFGNHEKNSKNLPADLQQLLHDFHEEAQRALQIAAEHRNDYIASVSVIEPVIAPMQRNQTLVEAYTAAKANIPQLAAQPADAAIHGRLDAGRADEIKYSEKQLTDNQMRIHTVATESFNGNPCYAAFCETQKANAVQSTLMQLPDTLNPKTIWESVCTQAMKDPAVIKELKLPVNTDPNMFKNVFARIEKAMQEKPLSTKEIVDVTKQAFKELGIDKSRLPNPNNTAERLAIMFDKTCGKHMTITNDKGNVMPHPDLIKIAMQQLHNLRQMKPYENEVNLSHASSIDYVYALKLCAHQMGLTVKDRSPYKNHPNPPDKAHKEFALYVFKHAEELGIPKITHSEVHTTIKNIGKDAGTPPPTRRP